MACRRLSSASSTMTDLGENDDEAEKEERRSKSLSSSESSSSFLISNLSPLEIDFQIAQCLKLNAENKINDKNAFQLKMIDFLSYTLKGHDSKICNLQMASACLDVSGKIYGFRVDRVHSDVLKIAGGKKRVYENEEDNLCGQDAYGNVVNQPKKKRKRKHNFISTAEALKGNLESYNPLSMFHHNIDMHTSDCLNQAGLPKHANQGISLNLYNEVVLDRLPVHRFDYTNFLVPRIRDFLHGQLCPSYDAFKFYGWSVDDEPMDSSEPDENYGEHHFDMDDPIEDDGKNNGIMDYRDDQDERFDRIAQNHNQDQQPLVDFQDIISNNPNPDATYEYSYVQDNYSIHLVKPSHWKVHIKRDVRYNGVTGSPKKVRRKKNMELEFTKDDKQEAETRFVLTNKPIRLLRATYMNWSDNNIMLPNFIQYDNNRFCSFFTNDKIVTDLDSHGKVENKEEELRGSHDVDDIFNLSNLKNGYHDDDGLDLHLDDQIPDHPFSFSDSEPLTHPPLEEAFLGQNLVSLPKLTDNIFIPYSQRAKRVDMRQLKKSIRRVLQNQQTKEFSQLYRVLPVVLSKTNAQSLSPGLAFTSLLHVSHERNLVLQSHSNYADVTITNSEKIE